MTKKFLAALPAIFVLLFAPASAMAHFGMVIPSTSTVTDKKESTLNFQISFSHPFARHGMHMAKPEQFYGMFNGHKIDLTNVLKSDKFMDHDAWTVPYTVAKPGVYQFAVVPQPYFEPAEDCFIIHFAKTVIGAFGDEDGWDEPLGLPVEIVPLTRPFANYAGNVFQGVVLKNGKPLPGATVEIENLNEHGKHVAPNEYFETQTVKTDANGVFTAAIPWAGWWGFAALTEGENKLDKDGTPKDVELGGIIWVQFTAPKVAKIHR